MCLVPKAQLLFMRAPGVLSSCAGWVWPNTGYPENGESQLVTTFDSIYLTDMQQGCN